MSCNLSVDVEHMRVVRLDFCQAPFCYPGTPWITTILPRPDADLNLWVECLRRAYAAHCQEFSRDAWRQVLNCAAELWKREQLEAAEDDEEEDE